MNEPQPIPASYLDVRNLPMVGQDPLLESYYELLAPGSIHLRLGSAHCDSNCTFCERVSINAGDKPAEEDMPLAVWEQVRDKYLPQVNGIEAAGLGEPLLAKLFPQVARETLAAGKTLYFPTNGHYLDTKLTDCLGDGTNVRVSVSFDAGDPEGYVSIGRGKVGEWEKTWDAIDAFRIKCPNAFLHSQYTASKVNIAAMPEFVRKAAEHGITEIIMRFVQNHAEAREDMSLRFAKEETEAAITESSAIASAAGIMFIAERRPYAEEVQFTPQDDGFEPMSASEASLARYLSFVPMAVSNCPSAGCITDSRSVRMYYDSAAQRYLETDTFSNVTCTYINGTCVTSSIVRTGTDSAPTLPFDVYYQSQYSLNCTRYTVIGSSILTCISDANSYIDTRTYSAANGPSTTTTTGSASMPLTSTCSTNVYTCPVPYSYTFDAFLTTYINYACQGTCTTQYTTIVSTSAGARHDYFYSSTVPSSCFGVASASGPEIVRSVKVPRTQLSPQSVLPAKEIPITLTDASVIAWEDGTLSTCFARHGIGNVFTDTWETLIKNARYQAFLHNRMMGDVNSEGWCRDCPRVM